MMMMTMMMMKPIILIIMSIRPEGAGCQLSRPGRRVDMASCVSLTELNRRRLKAPCGMQQVRCPHLSL